jgi:hypothetical protein
MIIVQVAAGITQRRGYGNVFRKSRFGRATDGERRREHAAKP